MFNFVKSAQIHYWKNDYTGSLNYLPFGKVPRQCWVPGTFSFEFWWTVPNKSSNSFILSYYRFIANAYCDMQKH